MGAYKYLEEMWRLPPGRRNESLCRCCSFFSLGQVLARSGKKQSDVMRFFARLRNWECEAQGGQVFRLRFSLEASWQCSSGSSRFRQLPAVHRCTRPTRPDKAPAGLG